MMGVHHIFDIDFTPSVSGPSEVSKVIRERLRVPVTANPGLVFEKRSHAVVPRWLHGTLGGVYGIPRWLHGTPRWLHGCPKSDSKTPKVT